MPDSGQNESYEYELFVLFAAADADFVEGYLLPEVTLPAQQTRLVSALPVGGSILRALTDAVTHSRFTAVVLSPRFFVEPRKVPSLRHPWRHARRPRENSPSQLGRIRDTRVAGWR